MIRVQRQYYTAMHCTAVYYTSLNFNSHLQLPHERHHLESHRLVHVTHCDLHKPRDESLHEPAEQLCVCLYLRLERRRVKEENML